jgi:hypothetical protein
LNAGANTVTIASGASITGANSTRYIITQPTNATNGRLRQNNLSAGSRTFPIGSATAFLPLTITATAAGSDFSASVITGTTTNGLPGGTPFANRSFQVDAVWRVDRANGTAPAQLRFDWFSNGFEGANFTTLANTNIGIWRNTGTGWLLAPSTSFANDNTANFSSTSGTAISTFGTSGTGMPYMVANIFVLPSGLRSFRAVTNSSGNKLEWEIENVTSFRSVEIEQSADGLSFSFLRRVETSAATQYQFVHETDVTRKTWYRLRLETQSGQKTYSDIVVAGGQRNGSAGVVLLQNPVLQQLQFRYTSAAATGYTITDVNGRIIQTGMLGNVNGLVSLPVTMLPKGMYFLQVQSADKRDVVRFIKQ